MSKSAFSRLLPCAPLIALTVLSAPATVYAATTGIVQGTIRDNNGQPLRGVNVFLDPIGRSAVTDANGIYTFVGVDPGNYTVRAELVGRQTTSIPAAVTQDQTAKIDFALQTQEIEVAGGTIQAGPPPVRRTDSSTTTVVTARQEQQVRSQPYDLYQTPGLVKGQPGITQSPSTGISHIRGSDYNQTGYTIDGISILDPLGNTFSTNLVTIGLKSANFYTGGVDASYGGSTGGFINVVTQNGRDLRGGNFEFTGGPGNGWNYAGNYIQYGNVLADGKLDYYASNISFRNDFPEAVFGLRRLDQSNDSIIKFNYYIDPNNTITAFHEQGGATYVVPSAPDTTSTAKYDNQRGNLVDTGNEQDDFSYQSYRLSYLGYRTNFSPSSFASYRFSYFRNRLTVRYPTNAAGYYQERGGEQYVHNFDYENQISPVYLLRAGLVYKPVRSFRRDISSQLDTPWDALTSTGTPALRARGYVDFLHLPETKEFDVYLSNKFTLPGDKFAADLGLRYGTQTYNLVETPLSLDPDFSEDYLDPRLGLTFSPSRNTVFRTSYARTSQFADSRRVQYLSPQLVDRNSTAIRPGDPTQPLNAPVNATTSATNPNPTAAGGSQFGYLAARQYIVNRLKPSYANTYDLGVEQGFNVAGEQYTVVLTGFQRYQKNLINLYRDLYRVDATGVSLPLRLPDTDGATPAGYNLRGFNNDGRSSSRGIEFSLNKRQRRQSDWNGFFTYTGQVAKSTNGAIDTAYQSFFYNAYALDPNLGLTNQQFIDGNRREYPNTWTQRHTLYFLASKRISRNIETSINFDAGSGFPFLAGLGANTGAVSPGVDSQHSSYEAGGALFEEVPVVLPDRQTLTPINASPGRTGWHYKFTINNNFYFNDNTNLFFNVDNIFDRRTVQQFATFDNNGNTFYEAPTEDYPQGRVYYGAKDITTPISVQFGVRTRF